MRILLLSLLATVGYAPAAHAQWQTKSMRNPLPAQKVDQPLVLPRGWVEVGFGYEQHLGVGEWTADGVADPFDHARWATYRESITLTYGLSPRAELWWHMPFVQARLTSDQWADDEDIYDHSIGDPRFGWKYHLFHDEPSVTSVALEAWYKAPAAKESPAGYIGGPLNVDSFVFTTGTPDLYLGAAAKKAFGPVALRAGVGYMRRFSGIVQYLVELDRNQFLGRIKPGDQLRTEVEVLLQAGPLSVAAIPQYTYRMATKVGTTSPGINPSRRLKKVANSDGDALDLRSEVTLDVSRGLALTGFAVLPLMGEDLQFFPIEDLHPTFGPTFGGTLEVRY